MEVTSWRLPRGVEGVSGVWLPSDPLVRRSEADEDLRQKRSGESSGGRVKVTSRAEEERRVNTSGVRAVGIVSGDSRPLQSVINAWINQFENEPVMQ